MKKQLFFLLIIFAQHQDVRAMQIAQQGHEMASVEQVQQALQQKNFAQARVRKALYLRCGVTMAMLAAVVGCGFGLIKNVKLVRPPVKIVPPPPPARSFFFWRSSPPPPPIIVQPAPVFMPLDQLGTAKLMGFVGSVIGLIKNIGPCWQQLLQFGSLKRDTHALLLLQREALAGQQQLTIAQKVMHTMLEEKNLRDDAHWREQNEKLELLDKKLDEFRAELQLLLQENQEKHSAQIMQVQQSIANLTAQIAQLVQCCILQRPVVSSKVVV